MSQKTQKLKRQYEREKLKDQAEICYISSLAVEIGEGKLNLLWKAFDTIKDIKCPERTKYLKECISMAVELKLFETAYKLSLVAIAKSGKGDVERGFFLDIEKKYRGMNNQRK